MDRDLEIETDHFERIVAKLLSLAVLAERASSRCRPLRFLVLWLLRPAEAAAREFVTETIQAPLPVSAGSIAIRNGNDPADAMCLARSFRALARALGAELRRIHTFTRRSARVGVAPTDGATRNGASARHTTCRAQNGRRLVAHSVRRLLALAGLALADAPRLDTS